MRLRETGQRVCRRGLWIDGGLESDSAWEFCGSPRSSDPDAEDRDYLAILRPYAEGRFGRNEAQKQAFYDMALSRKRNMRRDFEAFYADVLGGTMRVSNTI